MINLETLTESGTKIRGAYKIKELLKLYEYTKISKLGV